MDNAYALAVIVRQRQQDLARAAEDYRSRRLPATRRRRRAYSRRTS